MLEFEIYGMHKLTAFKQIVTQIDYVVSCGLDGRKNLTKITSHMKAKRTNKFKNFQVKRRKEFHMDSENYQQHKS